MLWSVACGGSSASSLGSAATGLPLQLTPATVTLSEGQSQAFSAGGGSAPYSWTATGGTVSGSGASAQFVAGSVSGSYTVSISDATGTATAKVTISAPAAPAPTPTPTPAPTPTPTATRLFPAAGADWLYAAPTGTGQNISSITSGLSVSINAHDGGFDYPVQSTDGSNGCTTFTDTEYYDLSDNYCVPIPAGGFAPSVGAYGANDGHLVVIDTATGIYYDFWKLLVDGNGNPTSTNVGELHSGTLATSNGTPGTTASDLTGLAGVILPAEIACETCIQHALSVVVPSSLNSPSLGTQAPADKTDGSVSGGVMRYGAKLQFDPAVDIDSLTASTAVKAVMYALQQFGGVITDQTSGTGIGIYSALATTPDETGIEQIAQHLLIYY